MSWKQKKKTDNEHKTTEKSKKKGENSENEFKWPFLLFLLVLLLK